MAMNRPDFFREPPLDGMPEQESELDSILRPRQRKAGRIALIGGGAGLVTVFAGAVTNNPDLAFVGLGVVVAAPGYATIDYIVHANAIEAAQTRDSTSSDEFNVLPEDPTDQ